ncbi:MAG: hypothetical protein ACREQB_10865 [Candidatus Binataceae bacterium]
MDRIGIAQRTTAIRAIVVVGAILAAPSPIPALAQEDDWIVVKRKTNYGESQHRSAGATPQAKDGTTTACGMKARAPRPEYAEMVAQINNLWSSNYPVYESLRLKSIFSRQGGCIFYSPEFVDGLFGTWMNLSDAGARKSLLYAVFAHEIGHVYHGDFDWRRERVSTKTKELGADQFAGYTLARLNMQLDPDEVTKYYQLVGDDFVGGASDHGTGKERTAAFMDGWRRGRAGVPEQSSRPAGGLGTDYLPE